MESSHLTDLDTAPESDRPLLAGRYRVVRRLGAGGMGEVFLVEDLRLDDREFAVKMLPAFLSGNRRAMASLKREALHSMELSHPHIVTVRGFEETSAGQPFLVMDFIDGRTLEDLLLDEERLSEAEVLRIFGPIAEALDYAHSKGVVHRDVKPSNIMLRRDGTPVIMDFGVAREAKETSTLATGMDTASGTLPYMSPEQLRGERPHFSHDVYGLAATMWESLFGEPPFSRGDIRYQILNEVPAPVPGIAISDAMLGGILPGLAKAGVDRPDDCLAMLSRHSPPRSLPAPVALVGPAASREGACDLLELEVAVKEAVSRLDSMRVDLRGDHGGLESLRVRCGHLLDIASDYKKAGLWSEASNALDRILRETGDFHVAEERKAEYQQLGRSVDLARELSAAIDARLPSWGWGELDGDFSPPDLDVAIAKIEEKTARLCFDDAHALAKELVKSLRDYLELVVGRRTLRRVAAGATHSLVLESGGRVHAFGNGSSGQCDIPSLVVGMEAGEEESIISVAAGDEHSLVLTSRGRVVGWGAADRTEIAVPPRLRTGEEVVLLLASGPRHALAVLRTGGVVAWGENTSKQCDVPGSFDGRSGAAVAVACGRSFSLAIRRDGFVQAWGSNAYGQCEVPREVAVVASDFVSISCGLGHVVGLTVDGRVFAWGDDRFGQCSGPAGVDVFADRRVMDVGATNFSSILLWSDGSLQVFGAPIAIPESSISAGPFGAGLRRVAAAQLSVGRNHCLVQSEKGEVFAFGDNYFGQCEFLRGGA